MARNKQLMRLLLPLSLWCSMAATALEPLPQALRKQMMLGDFDGALPWLTAQSKAGNHRATIELATLYRLGRGVPKDLDVAVALLRPSAEAQVPEAERLLASILSRAEPAHKRSDGGADTRIRPSASQAVQVDNTDLFSGIRPEADPSQLGSAITGGEQSPLGTPILIFAVERQAKSWIPFLLGRGAKVDGVDSIGNTALHYAARVGDVETVKTLLRAKARVDFKNGQGQTPLQMATGAGHVGVTRLLLRSGANPALKNKSGWSAQMIAARQADPALTALYPGLVQVTVKKRKSSADSSQATLLHYARIGNLARVEEAIAARVPLNTMDAAGETALSYAVKHGHGQIVKRLLDAGVSNAWRDENALTLLHAAVTSGQDSPVLALIESGADVNAIDNKGRTPLLLSIKRRCADCMKALVNSGADPGIADKKGHWPIFAIAKIGDVGMLEELLEHDSEVERMDSEGRTPLWWSVKKDHIEFATRMLEVGAQNQADDSGVTPLHLAVQSDQLPIVSALVSQKTIELATKLGNTPLILASHANASDSVALLLNKGADLDTQNTYGDTPLLAAVQQRSAESAALLISAGASVNSRNKLGQSVRSLVREMDDPQWTSLLESAPGTLAAIFNRMSQ